MLKCTKMGFVGTLCLVSVLFCGCDTKLPFGSTKPNFDSSFTVDAEINCDKLNAKAEVTRISGEEWRFTFSEPKELTGVVIEYSKSACTGTLGGLSFKAESNSLYSMVPEIIMDSINSLSNCTNEQIVQNDEILTYETEFNDKKVTVTANAKNNSLVALKCPYHRLAVNFSDLKPYKEQASESTGETGH